MAGLLDEELNQIMTSPMFNMGLGLLANSTQPKGTGVGQGLARGALQGMENVQQAQLMKAMSEQRKLQALQQQQALQQAQQRQAAIAALPEAQRQAVMAGVPIADIWKRDNPEMKFETYYDEQGRERKGYVTPQGITPVGGAKSNLPEGMVINEQGQRVFDPAYLQGKKEMAAAGRSQTNVFTGQKETFKNERDLRNDFSGLPTTKAFGEVQSAYDQIKTSLKKESPAGDLAAATKFMKILDPGSVVRESELGMAMQATGAVDRLADYHNRLLRGTKLTPAQRKDFGDLAEKLYGAAADRYDSSANEYQTIATDYGLDPNRIAKKAQRSTMSSDGWSAKVVK